MAISRSLMNRQLQADGGIMQIAPREKFGLGSKLKKFVRKIIPNEVAEIAVKAAPFVAPFNPAVAAAMSGLGSFDQTGRIGSSLKSGALTYGLGQGARFLGGAGFQGNPFSTGGAFTGSGFTSGFSSPFGTQTGIGKMLSDNAAAQGQALKADGVPQITGVDGITADAAPVKSALTESFITADAAPVASVLDKTVVTQNNPSFLKNLFDGISNQDYGKVGNTILDGAKKFGKAMFTNKDGSIDKAAVMGAIAFTSSYIEALALADEAGIDLSEEEYNEARKAEKQEEYAGYLTNFFAGQKDGGRIGFESGANEMIKTKLLQDIMPTTEKDEFVIIMTEEGPKMVLKSNLPSESMMMDTTTGEGANILKVGDSDIMLQMDKRADGGRIGFSEGMDEARQLLLTKKYVELLKEYSEAGLPDADSRAMKEANEFVRDFKMADGGRIGFKKGSPEESSEIGIMSIDVEAGDDENDMDSLMAGITFSSAEKSYLFRKLAGQGGASRSYTMPNLYRILSNPNKYPTDAAILKEIAIMGMKKDGGRIKYKSGANRVSELLILRDSMLAKDPDADVSNIEAEIFQLTGKVFNSVGGLSEIPTGKLRKNNAGVIERDYRDEGGFVPVGIKERADDVPAMLSKNEFVMTADAVRGIGGGDVEKGSKKLYNVMKQAEKVGKA